ncbi:FtsB family cell division protein [Evtepia sp.]|jgi:cell division protein FtsL|uniref:FtsB family cell division protein n=1 Tax=Evtepia sp. TaxID=2773933 RepID=UPI00284D3E0F|nr:septum formation initiator family protein [Evtepia sp.]MDR3997987.1 septum formation initiator family protein [Evtepia sp.]
MLRAKKVGLLVKIALLILLAYLIITLVNVRQQIGDAHAAIETLTEQVNDQTQANTELSNAIENRNDPSYLEDVARERLGLVAPNDRVFYIAD